MYVCIYIYICIHICTSSTSRKLSIHIYMHFFYQQKTQHISKTHASISRKPSKFASNSTSTKFRFAPNKNPKHVLKAYANSSSTNRKPNMVKPMLLAVENPAIGKNCFHFYQQKTQDVSSQYRKTSMFQKNFHQATYCKWNFQQISEMCNRKPSSKNNSSTTRKISRFQKSIQLAVTN